MTFNDLNLNRSLWNALEELGYIYPTPIQLQAFPVIMSGRDIVGIAQTGTGKTFAYLLPLLRLWKFSKQKYPRVLILVPTRELVLQVVGEVEKLTTYMNVRIGGVYGGTNIKTQKIVVQDGLDMLVATPGRLLDLVLTGVLRLKKLKHLVIDEVDEMLNLGFRTQLTDILDVLPEKRQNLLFSATLTEDVAHLIETFFNQPQQIEIARTGTPLEQINQSGYHVPNFNTKVNLLKYLLQDETLTKVLVFIGTKKLANRLFEQLKDGFKTQIGIIHSNKSQNYRINAIKNFHEGTMRVLIATDIIARGLDISEVSHVINFDTPEVPEHYIHRIGRTGRADRHGIAITFITPQEQPHQMAIETLMKKAIPILPLSPSVELSKKLIPEEIPTKGGDKNYLPTTTLKNSKGAFHEKKAKNQKVNLAHQRRKARQLEKQRARKRKKK